MPRYVRRMSRKRGKNGRKKVNVSPDPPSISPVRWNNAISPVVIASGALRVADLNSTLHSTLQLTGTQRFLFKIKKYIIWGSAKDSAADVPLVANFGSLSYKDSNKVDMSVVKTDYPGKNHRAVVTYKLPSRDSQVIFDSGAIGADEVELLSVNGSVVIYVYIVWRPLYVDKLEDEAVITLDDELETFNQLSI